MSGRLRPSRSLLEAILRVQVKVAAERGRDLDELWEMGRDFWGMGSWGDVVAREKGEREKASLIMDIPSRPAASCDCGGYGSWGEG